VAGGFLILPTNRWSGATRWRRSRPTGRHECRGLSRPALVGDSTPFDHGNSEPIEHVLKRPRRRRESSCALLLPVVVSTTSRSRRLTDSSSESR